MKVLAMFDPATRDLHGVLRANGDRIEDYYDPPDHYWETIAQTTLGQKPSGMSWDDFFEQLPDRVPAVVWWELVDVGADDMPTAFAEVLAGIRA